jgi:leader peptidase (prepilin peptidase)/N-methyltransferase
LFRRQREVPYGPYLSLATVIVLFGWDHIWPKLSHYFDFGLLLPPFAVFAAVLLAASLLVVEAAKRALGIAEPEGEWIEEWTPADQLQHFAGNKLDDNHRFHQTTAQREWPGTAAARGTLYSQRWRDGATRR